MSSSSEINEVSDALISSEGQSEGPQFFLWTQKLDLYFKENQYPSDMECDRLSNELELGLTAHQIKLLFKNKRNVVNVEDYPVIRDKLKAENERLKMEIDLFKEKLKNKGCSICLEGKNCGEDNGTFMNFFIRNNLPGMLRRLNINSNETIETTLFEGGSSMIDQQYIMSNLPLPPPLSPSDSEVDWSSSSSSDSDVEESSSSTYSDVEGSSDSDELKKYEA